jgi:fucose permease
MFGCLVAGASGSAVLITVQASLADHHSLHRPVALTEANMSTSIGTVIAPLLIGGSVAAGLGWRPAFFAPLAIFAVLFSLLRFEGFPSSEPLQRLRGTRVLPSPYWFFWLAFIPAVGAEWCVGAWGADYLVTVAGAAKGTASFLMSAFFGAMVLGRFLGGRLARTISPMSLLYGTTAVGLVGTLVLVGSSTIPGIVVGLFLGGLGISLLFPMLLALAIGTASDRSDIAAARIAIAAGGSVIVAPLTLGVLADQIGIRSAFSLAPGLLVFVVLFAALGRRSSSAAEVSL